jgi:hypothetical protein
MSAPTEEGSRWPLWIFLILYLGLIGLLVWWIFKGGT